MSLRADGAMYVGNQQYRLKH